jgi:Amt family ammonium transporter
VTMTPLLLALQDAGPPTVVPADTAWMLVSTALVLLMTPALAFFYGGLVRNKNSLNTMMMSFVALGAVGITWAVAAYSLALGEGGPFLGGLAHLGLNGVGTEAKGTIPHLLFMAYQGTFAIITAALISGAVVERMRFGPYVAFIVLWTLLVYAPVAHWVWGGGWLMSRGVLDFAGGTVVHINAGVSALVAAIVLGARKDYGRQAVLPHSVPFTLLGAGLLWFGWFGFNGGSALAANGTAALAFTNTFLAPMATLVVWTLVDYLRTGRATAVGAATGIVVGLVAVTPAAGFVSPAGALVLGAVAALPSYLVIALRPRTRIDDSLDVFAGHGVGGLTGALLTGVLAQKLWNSAGNDGLLYGNAGQLGLQALGSLSAAVYAAIMTFVILRVLALVTAIRAVPKVEGIGMDVSQHGEEAYASGEGSILVPPEAAVGALEAMPAFSPQVASR